MDDESCDDDRDELKWN